MIVLNAKDLEKLGAKKKEIDDLIKKGEQKQKADVKESLQATVALTQAIESLVRSSKPIDSEQVSELLSTMAGIQKTQADLVESMNKPRSYEFTLSRDRKGMIKGITAKEA